MTAFDEYDKERREIDELLFKGYVIQDIRENLDGALVKFVLQPHINTGVGSAAPDDIHALDPAPGFHRREVQLELPLLTADARKYVVTRYIEMKRSRAV